MHLSISSQPAAPRTDLYTNYHKRLRGDLFDLAIRVGRADFSDPRVREPLRHDLEALVLRLREHAQHEESFIHPLLEQVLPEVDDALRTAHGAHEADLDRLDALIEAACAARTPAAGLALYRGLNHFIAGFLFHLEAEEEVMPMLQERLPEAALAGAMAAFRASRTPEQGRADLAGMMPFLAPAERAAIYQGMRRALPEEVFEGMCRLAEAVLEPADWRKLADTLREGGERVGTSSAST